MTLEIITEKDAYTYLNKTFSKAGRVPSNYDGDARVELIFSGVKRFKRASLGLCGSSSVKSLDELAKLLSDTNIAESTVEGTSIAPQIVTAFEVIKDGISYGNGHYVNIMPITRDGRKMYKITAYTEGM